MQGLAAEALRKLEEQTTQGLSNLAWAWATSGVRDYAMLSAIAGCSLAKLAEMEPQSLANLAWLSGG